MVQSTEQITRAKTRLAVLESEIRDALADGVSLGELRELVSTLLAERRNHQTPSDVPIYQELPPGLIAINEAARKYQRSRRTFQAWIRRGLLELKGRLRAPARGGGKLVVSEAELVALMANPPRPGRPALM